MKSQLIDSTKALEVLGLYDPKVHAKPNIRHIASLVKRELLPRIKLGARTYRYHLADCESLLTKAINGEIILIISLAKSN